MGVVVPRDLDGFKRVNDSLGHDAGDRVLRWVSEQLRRRVCGRSTFLARMGGDEFTALLDLEFPEQAAKIAEKLIERVSICQQIEGLDIALGASIGIATFPDCGANLDGLLRASDIAMYDSSILWPSNGPRYRKPSASNIAACRHGFNHVFRIFNRMRQRLCR